MSWSQGSFPWQHGKKRKESKLRGIGPRLLNLYPLVCVCGCGWVGGWISHDCGSPHVCTLFTQSRFAHKENFCVWPLCAAIELQNTHANYRHSTVKSSLSSEQVQAGQRRRACVLFHVERHPFSCKPCCASRTRFYTQRKNVQKYKFTQTHHRHFGRCDAMKWI